jgi:hypothetical protein
MSTRADGDGDADHSSPNLRETEGSILRHWKNHRNETPIEAGSDTDSESAVAANAFEHGLGGCGDSDETFSMMIYSDGAVSDCYYHQVASEEPPSPDS